MIKAQTKVWTDPEFVWIKPLLSQWIDINRDFLEENDCDNCFWWHNERVNISSFAGAIWRSGGFALEEYPDEKGRGKTKSNGRIDLYFLYDDYEVVAEAKMGWLYLCERQSKDFDKYISSKISETEESLKHTMKQQSGCMGLALTFIASYSPGDQDVTDSMDIFYKSIQDADCSFYAWFKNISGKNIEAPNGDFCNAVALLGKFV